MKKESESVLILMKKIAKILESRRSAIKRETLWHMIDNEITVELGDLLNPTNKTDLGMAQVLTRSDERMRGICRHMKTQGYPMGANHTGYYKIRNQEDFISSQVAKIKKIAGMWGTIKAEKLAFEKYLGIQLFLPKVEDVLNYGAMLGEGGRE